VAAFGLQRPQCSPPCRAGGRGTAGARRVHPPLPFAQEKLRYHAKTGTIIYRSKMHPVLRRNCEVFPAPDWLAALTAHIPHHGEHVVRYYSWYGNV
jgi:hypothetical protein